MVTGDWWMVDGGWWMDDPCLWQNRLLIFTAFIPAGTLSLADLKVRPALFNSIACQSSFSAEEGSFLAASENGSWVCLQFILPGHTSCSAQIDFCLRHLPSVNDAEPVYYPSILAQKLCLMARIIIVSPRL
jgi:hypothetical protein